MLALATLATVAVATADVATTDVTVYRVWPKTGDADYFGLTNVDSGDAGGDALFGISQLLLPQLCAVEPSFLWCENRVHLSGGAQWMVYTEYTVTTKSAFGEYAPCNPCSNAVFNGSSYDKPPTCPAGKPDVSSQAFYRFACDFGVYLKRVACEYRARSSARATAVAAARRRPRSATAALRSTTRTA